MVRPDKQRAALQALHAVLICARTLALDATNEPTSAPATVAQLARVLDVAEYLPTLMLEAQDATDVFRGQLAGLGEEDPMFSLALERFDAPR